MSDTVQVRGLRELQRGLSQLDPKLRGLLGRTNRDVATIMVAEPARRLAASLGGGHVRLARAGVITGRGTSRAAAVALRAGSVPDAFGQEFGSKQGPRKKQFDPWRGNADDAGYALFPTIRRQTPAIVDAYLTTIDRALAEAVR